jgi:hypothetical protein
VKRVVLKSILSAGVIATAATCQGQTSVYSLNICDYFSLRYESYHSLHIGAESYQVGLREYKIEGVPWREVEWFYSRTAQDGTMTSGTDGIISFRRHPFQIWVSPWLLGGSAIAFISGSLLFVGSLWRPLRAHRHREKRLVRDVDPEEVRRQEVEIASMSR